MAGRPTQEDLQALQAQIVEMQNTLAQLQNAAQQSQVVARREWVIRLFLKSPRGLHHEYNPRKTKLAYDGSNLDIWEREINHTLSFVFASHTHFTSGNYSFSNHPLEEQRCISTLFRWTVDNDLLDIVESCGADSPSEILTLLRSICTSSNRNGGYC
ncbi:Dcp1p-Dcp2p decapping enzyme complex alpha subunit [Puccinia graminis f. sp. tritici]|uniref:Dcp1p-Dcp2p decapping enzyme complex alpha subunit n=1 Tax=Puccinia graminis f. sp. tritici TaxID=56615 RepID=A0A5B0Q983_PUCGR|nr:Dcp1p-Dcp2p decapping enzyme complex alpha subunit [Puccinia graminis f. sp. tritici]